MSIKSKGRSLGRMIRRITGIPLPLAMRIGKKVAQGKADVELHVTFPEQISFEKEFCDCCGPRIILAGPKGSIQDWSLSDSSIRKEFRQIQNEIFSRNEPC